MARFNFDVSEYDAPQDFEIIPEGTEVRMKCTEAEDKETSTGGEMVAATFQIIEGPHKGRKVWVNFNVVNKSEKAQNFGRRMLSGWARACGKPNAKSTDELLEKPFFCKLGIEKGTGQYKDKNVIASFLMPEGSESRAAAQPQATTTEPEASKPAPAASTGDKKRMPWDD